MKNEPEPAILRLHSDLISTLVQNSPKVDKAGWDFTNPPAIISQEIHNIELRNLKDQAVRIVAEKGYVVFKLAELLNSYPADITAAASTFVLSWFGKPIRIFEKVASFWRPITVDPSRPINSSGGIGESPLHMDFVNASNPPDLICLMVIRPDPLGGGHSTLSDLQLIEESFTTSELYELQLPQFSNGKVDMLANIGIDINPFPVVDFKSSWKYRYTEKLRENRLGLDANRAIMKLSNLLKTSMITILLERGDMLILDQHRMVHGRLPLGDGQDKLPITARRLLRHGFIRA